MSVPPHHSDRLLSLTGTRGFPLACFLILSLLVVPPLYGQDTELSTLGVDTDRDRRPLVYLDCNRCDTNHIRTEIPFVDYVRDQEMADVHVFITDQATGGGGREYEFTFIGRQDFAGNEYTLMYTAGRNDTWAETRDGMNAVLKMGFMPYVMQTADVSNFSIEYEAPDDAQGSRQVRNDPWNHWVFQIYAGSIQTGIERNQSFFDSRWGFYADRVTADWKYRLRPYFNFTHVQIQRGEDQDPITSRRHRHGFDSYSIMSINDHWSVGLFGDYITRNDRNLNHDFTVSPGIEYSWFPYRESTRRSITFVYRLGYSWVDYYEPTIFDQTEQSLVRQRFDASVSFRQPWGDIHGGLMGSHYFHDFSHRRAEFFGRVSVRLMEGLSLSVQGDFDMIQDQLALPRGDATLEEILLEQRQLATDFAVRGSIALSYNFGSQFTNVVNTRF